MQRTCRIAITICRRYQSTATIVPKERTLGVLSSGRAPKPIPEHPQRPHPHGTTPHPPHPLFKQYPVILPEQMTEYFERNVKAWSHKSSTRNRIISFGIPTTDTQILLDHFTKQVKAGGLSDPQSISSYSLQRFTEPHDETSIDVIYSTVFFAWAARTDVEHREQLLNAGVQRSTLEIISQLVSAASRRFPQDEYPAARSMHRKIIMHVGPTNSGKTHHALQALAASKSGVYAGPLRLLAHEIWERLNTGQIVPLGVKPPPDHYTKGGGNPAFKRPCNMITGEEQKIVGDDVPLLSCTVEMVITSKKYDVGVIDEIQMIADAERGGGWTHAVLGLCAKELHLCGEESAVPIVQELLKSTGDEVTVRRYERLTPLVVEEESLKSDWKNVRKGDCIVSFRRSTIFSIKQAVEAETGLRCAVVYGRLPPEVRSEQAALFNDPDSGYDVLIGSDAIGMGLNLKIKRIIFDRLSKYADGKFQPLSVSSVKQIAGRAGRYGLSRNSSSDSSIAGNPDLGGTVTTLHRPDIPYLKECLAAPSKPIALARVTPNLDIFQKVFEVLPSSTTPTRSVLEAIDYIGMLGSGGIRGTNFQLTDVKCSYLDVLAGINQLATAKSESNLLTLTTDDRMQLLYAPIPWRDTNTLDVIKGILRCQAQYGRVWYASDGSPQQSDGSGINDLLEPYIQCVENTENTMLAHLVTENPSLAELPSFANHPALSPNPSFPAPRLLLTSTIQTLETIHKILVFYMWMSFRNPVVYASYDAISQLKLRVEIVLNWCLQRLGQRTKGVVTSGPKGNLGHTGTRSNENKSQYPPLGLHGDSKQFPYRWPTNDAPRRPSSSAEHSNSSSERRNSPSNFRRGINRRSSRISLEEPSRTPRSSTLDDNSSSSGTWQPNPQKDPNGM